MEYLIDMKKMLYRIKILTIGKNNDKLYNKFETNEKIEFVNDKEVEMNVWENADIGFIIAYNTNSLALDEFQYFLELAKEKLRIVFPIVVSDNELNDNFIKIKPTDVSDIGIDYYIYRAITSISDMLGYSSVLSFDMEDLRAFFKPGNKAKFTYGDSCADRAIIDATNIAVNRVKSKVSDTKAILFNILGNEEKISMQEIENASKILGDYYKEASIIWGVGIDNNLKDDIRVSIWLFY